MQNIRHNVFETNSSSSHSFSVHVETEGVLDTIAPDKAGLITLKGGNFSKAEFYIQNALEKANAIAVYCEITGDEALRARFTQVMLEHTGATGLIWDVHFTGVGRSSMSSSFECNLKEALGSKKDIKNFIFNHSSHIEATFGYDG